MEPYTVWEDLRSEAARLWEIYNKVANVSTVTRVAARYINLMRVPMDDLKEFGDYLVCPPEVPEALPQGVSSFLTRIVFSEPTSGAQCILTQALEGPDVDNRMVPIVLDIDVVYYSAPISVNEGPVLAGSWISCGISRIRYSFKVSPRKPSLYSNDSHSFWTYQRVLRPEGTPNSGHTAAAR